MGPRPPSIEQQSFIALEHILHVLREISAQLSQIHIEQKTQTEVIATELDVLEASAQTLSEIAQDLASSPTTESAAILFGESLMANPGTQVVGSTLTATFIPLEQDGTTQTPGAVLSTQPTWASSDSTIATVSANADGTATVTGVAAGTVTITATGGVFTDLDGVATAPLDASNSDTVTQPTGRTVSAAITFS